MIFVTVAGQRGSAFHFVKSDFLKANQSVRELSCCRKGTSTAAHGRPSDPVSFQLGDPIRFGIDGSDCRFRQSVLPARLPDTSGDSLVTVPSRLLPVFVLSIGPWFSSRSLVGFG